MARKKAAASVAEAANAPSLEEAIKKLMERGKKRGSLTYEEINAVFENVEDVNPERIDELFEEIAAMSIEVAQHMLQASAISGFGNCAGNCDSVRGCKTVFTHVVTQCETLGPE